MALHAHWAENTTMSRFCLWYLTNGEVMDARNGLGTIARRESDYFAATRFWEQDQKSINYTILGHWFTVRDRSLENGWFGFPVLRGGGAQQQLALADNYKIS